MSKTQAVRVADLRVGDLVDLAGDKYADDGTNDATLAFEYVEVVEVVQETPTCVAVGFEGFDVVGFPPDHVVKVYRPEGN